MTSPPHFDRDILEDYKQKLELDWKHECRREQGPDDPSPNIRHFYDVSAIETWMLAGKGKNRNGSKLLTFLTPKMKDWVNFPPTFDQILEDGELRYLKVFSLLLALGYGELIVCFRTAYITDENLERSHLDVESVRSVEEEIRKSGVGDPGTIMEQFKKERWSFCPITLDFAMHKALPGPWIPPFLSMAPVNETGGTSTVYKVIVKQEFLSEELKKGLTERFDKTHDNHYVLALKSYSNGRRTEADNEKTAYSELKEREGLVNYLGCYSVEEEMTGQDGTSRMERTTNLLLEYGELDLDEYFADPAISPPAYALEIINFYREVFKIANVLRCLHKVPIERDGQSQVWKMCHADIKPANILLVNKQLKLIDLGYSTFSKSNPGGEEYTQKLRGGTRTFRAPEIDKGEKATQAIDIWSFGTVLLITATWVVFGLYGPPQFKAYRTKAVKLLHEARKSSTTNEVGELHDAFFEMLPLMPGWFEHVRRSIRKGDVITERILKIIEEDMLIEDSTKRPTFEHLCQKFDEIIAAAEKEAETQQHDVRNPETLKIFLNIEKEASVFSIRSTDRPSTEGRSSTPEPKRLMRQPTHYSSRLFKDEKMNKAPLARTPGREKVIKDKLRNSDESDKSMSTKSSSSASTSNGSLKSPRLESAKDNQAVNVNSASIKNAAIDHHFQAVPRSRSGRVSSPERQRRSSSHLGSRSGLPPLTETKDAETSASDDSSRPKLSAPYFGDNNSGSSSLPIKVILPSKHENVQELESKIPGKLLQFHDSESSMSAQNALQSLTQDGEIEAKTSNTVTESQIDPITTQKRKHERQPTQNPTHQPTQPRTEQSSNTLIAPKSFIDSNTKTSISSPAGAAESNKETGLIALPGNTPNPEKTEISGSRSLSNDSLALLSANRPNIFQKRQSLSLEMEKRNWMIKLSSKFLKRMSFLRKPDKSEFEHFIYKRDIIFLVDNSLTMTQYRYRLTFVVETLAMLVHGLDEDGIDMHFTIGDGAYSIRKAKDSNTLAKGLLQDDCWASTELWTTDMATTLKVIYDEHLDTLGPSMKNKTIYVLTDGKWDGLDDKSQVKTYFVQFLKDMGAKWKRFGKPMDRHHFTIQFIQFGEDRDATIRLTELDDQLSDGSADIPDVIDHVSWTGSVDKILLGSIKDDIDNRKESLHKPGSKLELLCEEFYRESQPPTIDQLCQEFNRIDNFNTNLDHYNTNVQADSLEGKGKGRV